MRNKRSDIINYVLSLAIVVIITFLASLVFVKFDLTAEKRHSLTDATIEMLEDLDDVVYVRVYLHGEFPAQYKRLEKAIREGLDEFKDYSGGKVQYEFIDPYSSGDKKTMTQIEERLVEEGLQFTRISYEENGAKQFKLIWPGAIMTYKEQSMAVQLLKSENPSVADEMINASVNNLEYEFSSQLRQLIREEKPKIAILEGQGELNPLNMIDFESALAENYSVSRVEIKEQLNSLSTLLEGMANRVNKYDLLVVAKPTRKFSNKDKLIIDQFVMNGGKVLWMIDPIFTDLDSLGSQQQTLGVSNEMGLYDMLFDYGVRINRDMVIDYQCAPIAFDGGPMGNQRNVQLYNWYYSPLIIPQDSTHPIINNLDPIFMEFASSLDTVGEDPFMRKTVLLESSKNSKRLMAPIRVNTSIVNFDLPYFEQNPNPYSIMGVLLEGVFHSNFTHRLPDTLKFSPEFAFRSESVPTAMVVITDGDIARNKLMQGKEGPLPVPLGYSRYAGRVLYDNKEFLLNTVNYLLNDEALISLRSRSITLRKLNAELLHDRRLYWQLFNVLIPLCIVFVSGAYLYWRRKKKYGLNRK